jgi:hypothetical protein
MSYFKTPPQVAEMANSLYHSLQGEYFVGYADDMFFEKNKNAWAMLFNPRNSGVNLFVNVWTVTDINKPLVQMQIWLNSTMHGYATESTFITPSNTAMDPLPKPMIHLLQASNVSKMPSGGVKAFARIAGKGETVVAEEDGKFIIPPGGNFSVFLSGADETDVTAKVRVGYGWWESRICEY